MWNSWLAQPVPAVKSVGDVLARDISFCRIGIDEPIQPWFPERHNAGEGPIRPATGRHARQRPADRWLRRARAAYDVGYGGPPSGVGAGELDAEQFAYRATAAVASDQVPRSQLFGAIDGDTVVILIEPGQPPSSGGPFPRVPPAGPGESPRRAPAGRPPGRDTGCRVRRSRGIPANSPPSTRPIDCSSTPVNRPRIAKISAVRGCRFVALLCPERVVSVSTTMAHTPARASSVASINPAGPAPAMTTSVSMETPSTKTDTGTVPYLVSYHPCSSVSPVSSDRGC